jgi:excinuclease UvrABC ATPase subunit
MKIRKDCTWCEGTGRYVNKHGEHSCPECEIRELEQKALMLKLDMGYKIDEDKQEEVEKMLMWFKYPTANRSWQLIMEGEKLMRVDYSWMREVI